MADTHHAQGPGKSVLGIGQRIVSIMVEMVETRLRLAVVELEEEKANLFQLLLMLGLTMLQCAALFLSMIPVERELKRNFDLSGHRIAGDGREK